MKYLTIILLLALSLSLFGEQASLLKATALSLVLPGSGEVYTKNYTKAGIFFTTEIAIILSYLRFSSETKWAQSSYEQFALEKAGVPLNSDDIHYQRVQDFVSLESYNSYVIRYYWNVYQVYQHDNEEYHAELDKYLLTDDHFWEWENESDLYQFRKIRRNHRDLETYAKLSFAAGILNHLVSVIDSAISVKKHNKKMRKYGEIKIQPDLQKMGMNLCYEIKF